MLLWSLSSNSYSKSLTSLACNKNSGQIYLTHLKTFDQNVTLHCASNKTNYPITITGRKVGRKMAFEVFFNETLIYSMVSS